MVSDRPELATPTLPANKAGGGKQPRIRLVIGFCILVGLIGWFLVQRTPRAATVGITDRGAVDLKGLDTFTKTKGNCFRGYQVEAIGRESGGGQHYGLTLELITNPPTDIELIATLAQETCQKESAQIATTVTQTLNLTESRQAMQVSYRTKSGQRFIVP